MKKPKGERRKGNYNPNAPLCYMSEEKKAETRKKVSEGMKRLWDSFTPEEEVAFRRKLSEGHRRAYKKNKKKLKPIFRANILKWAQNQ